MRTTLTIDDDVAGGLGTGDEPAAPLAPFRVQAQARGFRPGIDPLELNQLADELEEEDFLSRARARQGDA
jgi:hypothetical protein